MIPREYFTLNEVLADWGISESELGYVVEMGQLTLSVRIYGSFTAAYGRARSAQPIPDFEGVVDLERAIEREGLTIKGKESTLHFKLNEPAIYDPALRCGMRIENNYLVTDAGVELLSPFPLDLALA